MRALTLHPHWAHAVAHLAKAVENRSRPIPRALIGERVAIHAGATLPRRFAPDQRWRIPIGREGGTTWEQDLRRFDPELLIDTEDNRWNAAQDAHGCLTNRPVWGRGSCVVDGREIATRSIVAVVTLRGHLDAAGWLRARAELAATGGLDPGIPEWADPTARWRWALTDVVALASPVAVPRGQLGLWKLDPETEAAVRREEDACRT